MQPPINFEREINRLKESPEFLRMLHTLATDIYNRLGTPQSATNAVISGSSGSGSSGTATVAYLAQTATVVVGANTITLPSGGFSSDQYIIQAMLIASDGSFQPMPQPSSQTALNFIYTCEMAGVLWYSAFLKT